MVKVRLNMKNGDKFMVKIDMPPNENINNLFDLLYKDYNQSLVNLNTFDLADCKYNENTSVAIVINEISSIEYGF